MRQSFLSWECIVVDGDSTDGTLEILREYESERFRWISEKDKGIYDAMNKGAAIARGEWLYFLGSDDFFYSKESLENVFQSDLSQVGFVYANVFDSTLGRKYDGPFDYQKLLLRNICHQAVFYRREIFEKLGGYDISFRIFGDWDLNIKCFSNPQITISYIDAMVAFYARGGASAAYNDVPFFRNVLFPARLALLEKGGLKKLRSPAEYDVWWRLLRSMRLSAHEKLADSTPDGTIPAIIKRMYHHQKPIPYSVLKIGVLSKAAMFVSYVQSLMYPLR